MREQERNFIKFLNETPGELHQLEIKINTSGHSKRILKSIKGIIEQASKIHSHDKGMFLSKQEPDKQLEFYYILYDLKRFSYAFETGTADRYGALEVKINVTNRYALVEKMDILIKRLKCEEQKQVALVNELYKRKANLYHDLHVQHKVREEYRTANTYLDKAEALQLKSENQLGLIAIYFSMFQLAPVLGKLKINLDDQKQTHPMKKAEFAWTRLFTVCDQLSRSEDVLAAQTILNVSKKLEGLSVFGKKMSGAKSKPLNPGRKEEERDLTPT